MTMPHTPATPATTTPGPSRHQVSARLSAWARPLWQKLNPRERQAVAMAAAVCAAALLWWGALAPALTTLRQAPARHAQLDAQLADMRRLSAVATRLQAQPVRGRSERLAALEADTRRLLGDTASVRVAGEQVTVSLRSAQPGALAQWLADVRANARLTPAEARLNRVGGANAAPGAAPWQGELVFALGGDGR